MIEAICNKCGASFEGNSFLCPKCEEIATKKLAQMMEEKIYCQCYKNGKKPALLTDWRHTNICQSCGKPKYGMLYQLNHYKP